MMPPRTMLDTDILSALMRQEARVVGRARDYLASHARLTFSLITRFEILRGLKARQAATQLKRFDRFCETCELLPVTDNVVDRAADIYATLHRQGALIGDADILIAATALTHGFALSSNNAAHFARVDGLTIINWLD